MASSSTATSDTNSAITQRLPRPVVHLSTQKPPPSVPSVPSPLRNPKRQVVGLARSYAARPLGHTVLVKTEFVYGDPGALEEVRIVGSWNEWHPTHMNCEEKDLWSVICMVPTGRHEFYFLVDGVAKLSMRHPVGDDGKLNWRAVYGPVRKGHGDRSAFVVWAQKTLEGLGIAGVAADVGGAAELADVADIGLPGVAVGKRRTQSEWVAEIGWATIVAACVSGYLVLTAAYKLVFSS